jgi:hypothetical protein
MWLQSKAAQVRGGGNPVGYESRVAVRASIHVDTSSSTPAMPWAYYVYSYTVIDDVRAWKSG